MAGVDALSEEMRCYHRLEMWYRARHLARQEEDLAGIETAKASIKEAWKQLQNAQECLFKGKRGILEVKFLLDGKTPEEIAAYFAQRDKESKVLELLLAENKDLELYTDWLKTQPKQL